MKNIKKSWFFIIKLITKWPIISSPKRGCRFVYEGHNFTPPHNISDNKKKKQANPFQQKFLARNIKKKKNKQTNAPMNLSYKNDEK